MKYCVFCAGHLSCNTKAIKAALDVIQYLNLKWDLDADCVGSYSGPEKVTINENDGNNTSIWFEDSNINKLIECCSVFSFYYGRKTL